MSGRAPASADGLRLALFTDTYTPQVNGVARTLDHLVRAIEARGGAVHVETVAMPGAAPAPQVRRAASVPFWAYPELRVAAPSAGAAERRLARFAPTLVHAATPFGVGLAGRGAARRRGVPMVTSYHTTFADYLAHYRLGALDHLVWPFLRWFHNSGRRTFVPSETIRRELAWQGFDGLRLWSRGVDTTRFAPVHRDATMRGAMGAGPEDFVVAYVGRLAPEKRVPAVLDAVRLLQARFGPRVRLAIAGDGPDRQQLQRLAPPGTWFAGMLEGRALSAFYASSDAFAFASDTETFGNVVLEAMASGVPVVAPDRGATTEFAHARSALLFPAAAPEALAGQLARLLMDPALRLALSRLGRAEAESRSWDAVWDRLVEDYREVSAPAPARSRQAA
ncbi:MAG: hypothetical protein RL139_39 [Gemmatimonadota bacterium]